MNYVLFVLFAILISFITHIGGSGFYKALMQNNTVEMVFVSLCTFIPVAFGVYFLLSIIDLIKMERALKKSKIVPNPNDLVPQHKIKEKRFKMEKKIKKKIYKTILRAIKKAIKKHGKGAILRNTYIECEIKVYLDFCFRDLLKETLLEFNTILNKNGWEIMNFKFAPDCFKNISFLHPFTPMNTFGIYLKFKPKKES